MGRLGQAYATPGFHNVPVSRRQCARGSQRVKTVSKRKGVKARVCCPKGEFSRGRCRDGMIVRTVMYPKKKYSKRQAERSAKQFR